MTRTMKSLIWQDVTTAPAPRAAVAWTAARQAILDRLQQYAPDDLEQLTLVITPDCWVIIGEQALLPWAQGVQYAAPSTDAAELWLPTHSHPDIAPALILQGLKDLYAGAPLLLWPTPACTIPLQHKHTLSTALLSTLQEILTA